VQPSISPELAVRRGRDAIEFYKEAFGATELHRVGGTGDNVSVVAQLAVGDTTFWVNDESPPNRNHSPESLGGTTVRLLLAVDDPAAVLARAIVFGATEISPVAEEHHWLIGRIQDPFGHVWEIARPPADWPPAAR
jgi:PhnB protein